MRVLLVYLAIGVVLAWACDSRVINRSLPSRLGSAALSLLAWPLWAPLTLLGGGTSADVAGESLASRRVRAALEEARVSVLGTPLQSLLPEDMLARLHGGLVQVERRHGELCRLLQRPEFQSPAVAGSHADNVRRLQLLERRDSRLLDEMAELAEALRTQLLVARFSGRDAEGDGARGLVTDLSTRVESMDAWFELSA
jgi:hypothetical protein